MRAGALLEQLAVSSGGPARLLRRVLVVAALAMIVFLAVLPTTWQQQMVFGGTVLVVGIALARSSRSHVVTLALMVLSLSSTVRYAWWRLSTTTAFFFDPANKWGWIDAVFILMLLGAEMYAFAILFLGFMQTIWPLQRRPVALPEDHSLWPHVDVVIPTYNEPMSVVRYTALASLNIDWPADKLHVYILDDGKREEFRKFAEEAGLGYKTRTDNKHAKAGNINRALEKLTSPFVAIFDCDHVPTRSFLQITMGWFERDRKLAMLQTPHHFYSPDPFERNLRLFRKIPNEGELFYGIVQDGNDLWNATFFCGSCAVLRRTALDEIGGIAVETVTEDAHTSLRMQMNGWSTAYINIPQAAGLATERLSGHIQQRVRWARGMVQILRTDNPLTARGLKLAQRLCYFNAMTHFMYALPRLIFMTAPLVYLFFSRTNVPGYWVTILAYALPHLTLSNMTNSRIQGEHRHSWWNEIYEIVLAPYILLPTLMALVNPKLGKFNVTAKGGVVDRTYFDHAIARPYMGLIGLNVLGMLMAIPRLVHVPGMELWWDGNRPGTIAMNLIWTLFNIVMLTVAASVARERVQRREQVRIDFAAAVTVRLQDGTVLPCETTDLSSGGVALRLREARAIGDKEHLRVNFSLTGNDVDVPAACVESDGTLLRVQFLPMSIEEEEMLTMVLYSRADAWLGWGERREGDQPLRSLGRIVGLAWTALRESFGSAKAQGKKAPGGRRRVVGKGVAKGVASALLVATALGPWRQAVPQGLKPHTSGAHVGAEALTSPQSNSNAGGGYQRTLTLRDLGLAGPMEMRGLDSMRTLDFALPRDVVVERATLHLVYRFSPGLIAQMSHINVMMNGTLFATLEPATSGDDGVAAHDLVVPAELMARSNELSFEFIGHYTQSCEDPSNTVLWSRIDAGSSLEVWGEHLALADDLKQLPLPFFDAAVAGAVVVPMVFSGAPSMKALEAAGVVASYFGVQARDRAVRFPVVVGSLPAGNVVLIAEAGGPLPGGIAVGNTGSPTLAMRTNPADPNGKVLVVAGGDPDQLMMAARALAMGWNGLQGASVAITDFALPAARGVDDAPRWERTEERVELWHTATDESLRSDGGAPLQTFFRLPPDLYFGNRANVLLHVDYRYNATPIGPDSSVQVYTNGAYIGSAPLKPGKEVSKATSAEFDIPVVALRPFSNSLSSNFTFQMVKRGACTDTTPINMQGAVVRTSYLDMRGLTHWTAMPNLELFANAGFPFTRRADLSETTVVLPSQPSAQEIELYLSLMGHFGAQTGYPGLRVSVGDAEAMHGGADLDFLVIATGGDNPAMEKIRGQLPVALDADGLHLRGTSGLLATVQKAWWRLDGGQPEGTGDITSSGAPDALIEGVESPFARGRSVVLIEVKDAATYDALLGGFLKAAQSSDVSGSVAVLHGAAFQSFRLGGGGYHVGYMPWWKAWQLWFVQLPWMAPVVVLGLALMLAVMLRSWLRERARVRLAAEDQ